MEEKSTLGRSALPWAAGALLIAALAVTLPAAPALFYDQRSLVFSLLVLLIGWSTGRRCLSHLGLGPLRRAEHAALSAGLGLYLLAMGVLALGLVRLLYPIAVILLLAVAALYSRRDILLLLRSVTTRSLSPLGLWDATWLFLLVLFFAIAFTVCLAPSTWFDALEYHLALPSKYLMDHTVRHVPYNLFSGFPQNTEMIYTIGLALNPGMHMRMLNLLFGGLFVLSVYALARRCVSRECALLAALVAISVSDVALSLVLAGADISMGFYSVLAFLALSRVPGPAQAPAAPEGGRTTWLWIGLAGALCGMAVGCKYLGLVVLIGLNASCLFSGAFRWRKADAARWFKALALLNAAAFATSLPWLLKNIVATGNPLYPFFYSLFGGAGLDPERAANLDRYIKTMGVEGSDAIDFVALPFDLSLSLNGFGPFFLLGMIFLALPVMRRERLVRLALVFAAPIFLYWLFTSHIVRYLTPMFGVLAALPAIAFFLAGRQGASRLLRPLAALLFITSAAIFAFRSINSYDPLPFVFMNESKEHYLSRAMPNTSYPVLCYINENLPRDVTVLFIGECRAYYLERPSLAASAFDRQLIERIIRENETVEEAFRALRGLGVTHLLYNPREAERLGPLGVLRWQSPGEERRFTEFLRKHGKLLYEKDSVFLFQVTE